MPLEIERKFLIAPGGVPADADWPVEFADHHIVQTYLVPKKDWHTSERVRMQIPTDGRSCTYTHTLKMRVSDGVHEEDEEVISKGSYTRLLKRADTGMVPVSKVRRVFEWSGRKFELDTFSHPFAGLVMMEVELPSMDVTVELPPFIRIEREVTTEKGYTNAALARKGRWP